MPDNPDLYFFLSYARSDDRDSIQQFFDDLSAEVRGQAGLAPETEVGFFDVRSMEVGASWSRELMKALAVCRTFVALVSPRYLTSEACGREWTVFADRLRSCRAQVPPALVPVLWLVPPNRLPEVVTERQYHTTAMPEAYRRLGLRQLIRLRRHRDDYLDLVTELGRHIVRTAQRFRVPTAAHGMDFHRVRSVFHPGAQAEGIAGPSPNDRVRFVVAAPSRADLDGGELAPVARDMSFYGDRPRSWAPYRPELTVPVAEFARAIAEERQFHVVVTDIGELSALLETADPGNQIVVLLVDPWSTRLAGHRRVLKDYDLDGGPATVAAVMVPANHGDPQTQAYLSQLTGSLREIFVRRFAAGHDVTFRTGILTHQSFDADLKVVLEHSRNRLFSTGTVHRRPEGPPGHRPILRGP